MEVVDSAAVRSAAVFPVAAVPAVPGESTRSLRFPVPSASQLFNDADRQRVNESVRLGESRTSAEIVPVVATTSGRYDRAEDLAGLWLGVLLMIPVVIFWPAPYQTESGSWGGSSPVWFIIRLIVAVVTGFTAGAVIKIGRAHV